MGSLFPTVRTDSAYTIDYKKLYELGIRGIIFDIDNTLVPHDAPADGRSRALMGQIHEAGIKTVILSNNGQRRVKSFADDVGCAYIFKAAKPKSEGFLLAMKKMGTAKKSTVLIGDQLFTDVWGASNAGIRSILVRRISFHERYYIHLKRILEYIIMIFYPAVRIIRKKDALEGALR
ncbi:MAG: YqeG family HAD IIIA-type phosphatase [Lachnospiraceae bacterium]|nr:YqeG family HAD IIIA-type phosphatase [Lachnospiraceae bacterium]